jgi:cysteine-rich secretory family protein
MKRFILILLPILALTSFIPDNEAPKIDLERAKEAFVFLNQVRQDPEKYCKELSLPEDLPVTRTALIWNDTLARAAEKKAVDMAKRNYFAHVDPSGYGMNYHINEAGYTLRSDLLVRDDANNFESIYWEYFTRLYDSGYKGFGIKAVKNLIIDTYTPTLGHRKHLLGVGTWNSSLTDAGIGFATYYADGKYKLYVCILIAKHGWL